MYKISLKKKGKKLVAFSMGFAMLMSFTACGWNKEDTSENNNKEDVFEELTTSTEEAAEKQEDSEKEVFSDNDIEVQNTFEDYLDRYFAEYVTSDTLTYNYTVKDGSTFGLEEPEVTLGDVNLDEEGIAEDKAEFDTWYNELQAIDRDSLTEDEQLTYDILSEYMEVESESYDNVYLYEPFSPMRGLQANYASYFTDYRFDDKGDVERYIALLNQTNDYFSECLEFEKTKSQKGYFMADEVADDVIEQCNTFTENKDDHFLITVFNDNVDELDFLTDEEKTEFKEENKDAVINNVIPAYENVAAVLGELKGTGTNQQGVCYYDNGKEYYAYLLKEYAGTSKTPEEVIDMLETEMENLMTELYQVYFVNMDAYEYFADNYDTLFSATDSMSVDDMIQKLMEEASQDYPDCGTINYKAEALDESLETIMEDILAYYNSPAYDDQDNNLIRVNNLHTDGLWTTIAHEGYPGHMLQNAYFMSTNPEPVRTIYNFLGYKEGWAMYACYDALNYYEFENEDYAEALADLYRINDELSYLVMGRIDLGINYEGWSLEETASYLDGQGFDSSSAENIYYTMVGDPAVYQSYSTGYYELKEIRDYAEEKLGAAFDVEEFNTIILETGPCQFDILKEQVDKKLSSAVI
jgi:uncharacterized protein (DUF885 family)